jgi:hypothetical protein
MKLELKHIAPYLPYGLKICWENIESNIVIVTMDLTGEKTNTINLLDVIELEYKPILRPLSHLTKEIEDTEECLLDYIVEKLGSHCVNYDDWVSSAIEDGIELRIVQAPYEVIEYCFENHYDVFQLIPRGLAIDINTIKI